MLTLTPTPELQSPPTELIYDDGEPMESNQHRLAMNVLIHSTEEAWKHRQDFFAGGNMFIYYSLTQAKNRDFRGPDFFVVLNTSYNPFRKAWVTWQENGRYPDVIVELMSPSTASIDKKEKKELYQNVFRTREYYIFDPFEPNSLQGWRLNSHLIYDEILPNDQGWLWCDGLNFWLGTWQGSIGRTLTTWLRFYHENGDLVLLPEEAERQKAEVAQQQVEVAQQQVEVAQQQAEVAQQKAELQRQKAEFLAARLRELGENPEDYFK